MSRRGGPRTEAGRAVARMSAVKHGFSNRSPVIPAIEEEVEWLEHHAGMVASLSPEGHFEELLVRRLANIFWHLDRLTAYEVASIIGGTEKGSAEPRIALIASLSEDLVDNAVEVIQPDPALVAEQEHQRLLPPEDVLNQIMRYGSYLHRQWVQTLHELEALQARRRGELTPLARVDFSSPPNMGPRRSPSQPRTGLPEPPSR